MARLAVARHEHDIRHSAEMHENAVLAGLVEQQPIHQGRQRKTLTAGRDIARAEIADDRDARSLRHHRRHAHDQRRGETALRLVRERVPRAADALHFLQAEVRLVRDESCRRGEGFAQQPVKQSSLLRRRLAGRESRGEVTQVAWICLMGKVHKPQARLQSYALRIHQDSINAIQARTGRQTDKRASAHEMVRNKRRAGSVSDRRMANNLSAFSGR